MTHDDILLLKQCLWRKAPYTGPSHNFQTASAKTPNGGVCFCSHKNGHKQLKQKKHNKSYFELNGGCDRGPGCRTEGPWGQAQSDTYPQSCWITFPAWSSDRMTFSNPGRALGRGYYSSF